LIDEVPLSIVDTIHSKLASLTYAEMTSMPKAQEVLQLLEKLPALKNIEVNSGLVLKLTSALNIPPGHPPDALLPFPKLESSIWHHDICSSN
jgi:hypothetical protein